WNPDEPRYAEVAREMQVSGDYLIPHLNGSIYSHKPPLLFWTICAASRLTGQLDELAVRLPLALSGLATLCLVLAIGYRQFSPRAAWVAVAALGSCWKFPLQAQTGQIDMLLVFLVTLSIYFWVRGEVEERPVWARLFFVSLGAAVLAKGPAGLLPPLLAILVFLALRRDREGFRRLAVGRGLLISLAVVAIWLVPAGWAGGWPYLEQIVFRQNVTRYVHAWGHIQPFTYYLPVILTDYFPWSLLLPAAVVAGWRLADTEARRWFRFNLCWIGVTLLFFSVSAGKRTVYILPMYPAMALVIGAGFERLAAIWPRRRFWVIGPLGIAAGVTGVAAVVVPRLVAHRPELSVLGPALPGRVGGILALMALALAAAALLAWRGKIHAAAGALAGGAAVVTLAATLAVLPPFDRLKSARPLAEALQLRCGPTTEYALYPRLEPPFLFYTRRFATVLSTPAQLRDYAVSHRPACIIAERAHLDDLTGEMGLSVLASDSNPTAGYVLLGNDTP
ncbi:MAG: ArnT family glycosyltransferase, partial [Acidobacteriota bacterium]